MDSLNRRRRISYFERLGEAAVRTDLESGRYRYVGHDPEAILLARQWLVDEEERERAERRRRRREEIVKWGVGIALLAFAATFFRL